MKKVLLAAFGFVVLFVGSARAQDPAAGGAARAPWMVACEGDVKKHCESDSKAGTDVRPCLSKHEADLSQECKDTFLRKYRIVEMCKDDIEKVCAGASGKALGECFNNPEKQKLMSEKCKSALRQGAKEHKQEAAPAAAAAAPAAEEKPAKPAKAAKKTKKSE